MLGANVTKSACLLEKYLAKYDIPSPLAIASQMDINYMYIVGYKFMHLDIYIKIYTDLPPPDNIAI